MGGRLSWWHFGSNFFSSPFFYSFMCVIRCLKRKSWVRTVIHEWYMQPVVEIYHCMKCLKNIIVFYRSFINDFKHVFCLKHTFHYSFMCPPSAYPKDERAHNWFYLNTWHSVDSARSFSNKVYMYLILELKCYHVWNQMGLLFSRWHFGSIFYLSFWNYLLPFYVCNSMLEEECSRARLNCINEFIIQDKSQGIGLRIFYMVFKLD